jgi:hypothetical protein
MFRSLASLTEASTGSAMVAGAAQAAIFAGSRPALVTALFSVKRGAIGSPIRPGHQRRLREGEEGVLPPCLATQTPYAAAPAAALCCGSG